MKPSNLIKAILQRFELLHHQEIDLGLDRIRTLLAKAGDPHLNLPPVIHVAGSNGKGSTIAFLAAMAKAQGLTVHVHTSPHLVQLNERYIIAGRQISDLELASLLTEVETLNDGAAATVFELLCVAMFIAFNRAPADLVIIEVGLGGELDATNVIEAPVLSLLTPISIEHSDWLGFDIAGIARAKAGIIKHGCPVISARQPDKARDVIEQRCHHQKSDLQVLGEGIFCHTEDGRLLWQDDQQLLDLPLPALQGAWQIQNAGLAIAAAVKLGWTQSAIASGLRQVKWPGRLQRLSKLGSLSAPTEIWLDGAHNPQAAEALAKFMHARNMQQPAELHMIVSMQTTKDLPGFFAAFLLLKPNIHLVALSGAASAMPLSDLITQVSELGFEASGYNSLDLALACIPKTNSRLLITGSLYLVGEVLSRKDCS